MLNEDYKEMLSALVEEKVEFLLIGAYALAVFGVPRATVDLDLFVKPSPENAAKLMQALARFGAPMDQINVKDFEHDDTIFQIGVAPRRIDILTGITALNFDEASKNAIDATIEGIQLKVISIQNMIKNKTAIGRTKDLADTEILKKIATPS
ncbi:MAG: nucleotidyltransferase [Candidatus Riflebacteria bacterium]|nr:nucleotidyltransferase [Candidatus Riflebacteria bacterium]